MWKAKPEIRGNTVYLIRNFGNTENAYAILLIKNVQYQTVLVSWYTLGSQLYQEISAMT